MSERMVQITEARFVELVKAEERLAAEDAEHMMKRDDLYFVGQFKDAELGALVRQMPEGSALFFSQDEWVFETCSNKVYKRTPEAALRAALEQVKP